MARLVAILLRLGRTSVLLLASSAADALPTVHSGGMMGYKQCIELSKGSKEQDVD